MPQERRVRTSVAWWTVLALCVLLCGPRIAPAQDRGRDAAGQVLETHAVAAVLETFKTALDERWSYRHANRADFDAAIEALRKRTAGGVSSDALGLELQTIIALGMDGHSGVSGYRRPAGGCLPFLIEGEGGRYVAVDAERTAFLADGFPYLTKIDGRGVSEWCQAAAVLVPRGSPQYVRHRCLRLLGEIDYWRGVMNLPRKNTVEVELAGQKGGTRKRLTLAVAASPPAYGSWPPGGSRRMDGDVGYLRLADMRRETSVPEIKRWMPAFRDTVGLVVDVRGNNGGERDALTLLYSYLASPGDPPRVFTASA